MKTTERTGADFVRNDNNCRAAKRTSAPYQAVLMVVAVTALCFLAPRAANGQQAGNRNVQSGDSVSGTVVSTSRSTVLVRTEEGRYVLFSVDRDTEMPASLSNGGNVRIIAGPEQDGVRTARRVVVVEAGAPAAQPNASSDVVPPEVRRAERQIQRQARRYRAGFRAGVGVDPEVLMGGVHANLGPFFHRDVRFRPNAEMAFGEVTTLFALNLEAVYRLPVTSREGAWSVYAGMGPGLNFINEDFERDDNGRDFDFDDFDYETSLNFLVGVEARGGTFIELKSAAFSRPQVRIIFGYTF